MELLFKGLPDKPGMAFIIVTHLNPERESILHEVLQRYTGMKVEVAQDEQRLKPDHIYVMPQGTVLHISKGILRSHPTSGKREPKPIDVFFSSLAIDQDEYAVGVILSGGDSDGTLGAKAIKERGGLTIAQVADGTAPLNPDMPQSAIRAGLIDIAVSAEDMGEKLVGFARSLELHREVESGNELKSGALDKIFALLRTHARHDFSGYKPKTFLRRVNRRMQVRQIAAIEDYISLLESEPDEVHNLFRDLLINVTNFFRDAEAFQKLESEV